MTSTTRVLATLSRARLPYPRCFPFLGTLNSVCHPRFHSSRPIDKSRGKPKARDLLDLSVGDGVCAAYCVSTPVSLPNVVNCFKGKSLLPTTEGGEEGIGTRVQSRGLNLIAEDVVHVDMEVGESEESEGRKGKGHVFFFSSGAAVFWGLPLDARKELLRILVRFQEGKGGMLLEMEEFEHEFRYTVDAGRREAAFRQDEIFLREFENVEELLALSYGLAQSVKLLLYEEVIDSLVLRTRTLPEELARDGRIGRSGWELRRLIGELMAARYSVNLVSDLLDTPEWFWQHAELERLHLECAREVELRRRVKLLDTRSGVIKEALDILNSEVSTGASDRVERAILVLIAVEVGIEVARMVSAGGVWS